MKFSKISILAVAASLAAAAHFPTTVVAVLSYSDPTQRGLELLQAEFCPGDSQLVWIKFDGINGDICTSDIKFADPGGTFGTGQDGFCANEPGQFGDAETNKDCNEVLYTGTSFDCGEVGSRGVITTTISIPDAICTFPDKENVEFIRFKQGNEAECAQAKAGDSVAVGGNADSETCFSVTEVNTECPYPTCTITITRGNGSLCTGCIGDCDNTDVSNIWVGFCRECGVHTCGEPHFQTFGGQHYDFQGGCDLVLADNPGYKNNKGLYIHGRTKVFGSVSFLVSAAVKIGDDILEIHGEDLPFINGIEFPVSQVEGMESAFPVKIGGYDLTVQVFGPHSRRHIIHMGNGEKIMINNFQQFVDVYLHSPKASDFEGSKGMWGTYSKHGSMVARDGQRIITDANAFGFEWQVRDTDPQLFHVIEGVQYPTQCEMPEQITATERHLRAMNKTVSEDDAKNACSNAIPDRMEDCIANVFGSDNLDMAQLYTVGSL